MEKITISVDREEENFSSSGEDVLLCISPPVEERDNTARKIYLVRKSWVAPDTVLQLADIFRHFFILDLKSIVLTCNTETTKFLVSKLRYYYLLAPLSSKRVGGRVNRTDGVTFMSSEKELSMVMDNRAGSTSPEVVYAVLNGCPCQLVAHSNLMMHSALNGWSLRVPESTVEDKVRLLSSVQVTMDTYVSNLLIGFSGIGGE